MGHGDFEAVITQHIFKGHGLQVAAVLPEIILSDAVENAVFQVSARRLHWRGP
jgi:hypothetical protein